GWALARKYQFQSGERPFWYGCILVTNDGGTTWQDKTGDLLGVTNPVLLPHAPLTDAVIVTDGTDHKAWIVGFANQVITGSLSPGGLGYVNPPPPCAKAPVADLYGVHAYYPYPGTVKNFTWVTGRCWDGGYIDWGYEVSPWSMAWG
ncbi:MAG: hypothetical protein ACPL68_07205, partial [Candidatus Hydrothermia bacterium]